MSRVQSITERKQRLIERFNDWMASEGVHLISSASVISAGFMSDTMTGTVELVADMDLAREDPSQAAYTNAMRTLRRQKAVGAGAVRR